MDSVQLRPHLKEQRLRLLLWKNFCHCRSDTENVKPLFGGWHP